MSRSSKQPGSFIFSKHYFLLCLEPTPPISFSFWSQ